jgi:hypothetical protein
MTVQLLPVPSLDASKDTMTPVTFEPMPEVLKLRVFHAWGWLELVVAVV